MNYSLVQYWEGENCVGVDKLSSKWQRMYPEFSYERYNLESARSFITKKCSVEALNSFNKCGIPAMRSDLFRILYILEKGGIYVDCALEPIGRLEIDFGKRSNRITLSRMETGRVSNSFIVAKKGSEVINDIQKLIINNITNESDRFNRRSNDILWVTGPVNYQHLRNPRVREKYDIELIDEDRIFSRINNLPHKKHGRHWTEIQQKNTIYVLPNS